MGVSWGPEPAHGRPTDSRTHNRKTARELIWTSNHSFQAGPVPGANGIPQSPRCLTIPRPRPRLTVWRRLNLAITNAPDQLSRIGSADDADSFTPRIRKLVTQGFKPKDAVELFLQEVALEYRNQPKVLAQAKADGEDFLRRVRAGLI